MTIEEIRMEKEKLFLGKHREEKRKAFTRRGKMPYNGIEEIVKESD